MIAVEEVVLQSGRVSISQIIVGDRKRELGDISSLAQSISEIGLLNPITILPDGSLVAGYHRLEACKRLCWQEIDATVVDLDSLNAELAEIDENLIRNELHWLDRDKQFARRKEIYEIKYPETSIPGRGKNQYTPSETISLSVPTFAEDTATKIGVSDRTIELSIQRANAFTEGQGEVLKSAEVTQTEATKLARLPEPERIAVIDSLKENRDAHVMRVMGSSESPEWYTPQEIVQLSIALLGEIDLDPCSNSHETPNVPAKTLYTKENDGLIQPWEGRIYLNPPYGSEIPQWVEKLVKSYGHGVSEAIALLPARIDTAWFQPLYEFPMCHIRGRLQFSNSPHSAPFPSVIVYLGERIDDFVRVFRHKGPIMRRIG